ncbi:hypothetical protein [Acinetobacter soli]|uniref:hypothetical protein n=1 Tax=Acinetobacter soli TaxID=487316 RepID=UPI0020917380|nr:hypothetical protein [Acinetobacter soli]
MSLKFEWLGENSAFECLCNKAEVKPLKERGMVKLNSANQSTGLDVQMSDAWIKSRANELSSQKIIQLLRLLEIKFYKQLKVVSQLIRLLLVLMKDVL